MISKLPRVSPGRTKKGKKPAEDAIELDEEATAAKMPDAAEGAKMMDELTDNITKENNHHSRQR